MKNRKLISNKKLGPIAIATLFSVSLVGCSSQSASTVQSKDSKGSIEISQPAWYQPPSEQQLQAAKQNNINGVNFTKGVNGEVAVTNDQIQLTDDDITKIKAGNYTAAIAMQYTGNDWSQQQIAGLESEFKKLGINVIAKTDANFKDSQQISDLEAISAKKPNILVSIPVNAQTESDAYKRIAAAGTKIVFMNQPVDNMVPGKDYVSVVSPDDYGNGMVAADELAKALNGKGDFVALYYAPDFHTTNLRYEGLVTRLKAKYPNIHLVAAAGFNDPNSTQSVASALLTKYPNIQAMWVAWDVPAMGAIAAARTAGKSPNSFHVVTNDLGNDVALNMAQNSYIYGLGGQRPFDAGVAEAKEAALSLISGKTHPFVAIPNFAVDRSNLKEAYDTVYHHAPTAEIKQALGE